MKIPKFSTIEKGRLQTSVIEGARNQYLRNSFTLDISDLQHLRFFVTLGLARGLCRLLQTSPVRFDTQLVECFLDRLSPFSELIAVARQLVH